VSIGKKVHSQRGRTCCVCVCVFCRMYITVNFEKIVHILFFRVPQRGFSYYDYYHINSLFFNQMCFPSFFFR